MQFVEGVCCGAIGVRREFTGLNPVSAALMKAGAVLHVVKHNCVIEGYPLPKKGSAIVTANHYSRYDPIIASHLGFNAGRIIRTVVKKSLVVRGAYESREFLESIGDKADPADYKPLEAFTMRGIGVIPILRDNPGIDFAKQCFAVLSSAQLLGIFLQETRNEAGLLRNLQTGAAFFASHRRFHEVPVYAIAFSKNKAIVLKPFTYNELRAEHGREISVAEFTVIIGDRIAAALPKEVQEDWNIGREIEFKRLSARNRA